MSDVTINMRFSRQVNYPDLAYNIQSLINQLKKKGIIGLESLEVLDLAYRGQSKTYEDFSKKYQKRFNPDNKEAS
tara:strand:- start:228 stop:452 length:225 start_codon:yes stop_codon:yes gene_type:complete